MKTKDKYIRIKWSTWKELRAIFKAKPKESVADYMQRLIDETIIWNMEPPALMKQ
jgi:hypothetical protein